MTRPIPNAARAFVKPFEALELRAYLCPAGVWTIGWGHTGPDVHKGLVITKAAAEKMLTADLEDAAAKLRARIGDVVEDLTDNQYAALLSFVFNLGAKPSWTIWKVLKARAFDQVPVQLIRFVYADGKKLNGLVRRRTEEVKLWSTDEPGSADESPPSGTTRFLETPPAPMEKPLGTSKSFVASAAGAVAMAPVAINQVSETIKPYAEQSPVLGQVLGTLAVIGAALAVAALVFQWLKARNGKR